MTSPLVPVLDALSDGGFIRRVVSSILRIIGVLILLAGIVAVLMTVALTMDRASGSADVMIGGILYALLLGAASFAIFEIHRYRATTVDQLGPSSFTVMPVMSIIFRLAGEAYAVTLLAVGVGGFILSLFGAGYIGSASPFANAPLVPGAGPQAGIIGGLTFMALSGIGSFLAILFFYFLAEIALVFADMARSLETLALATVQAPSSVEPAGDGPGTDGAAGVADGGLLGLRQVPAGMHEPGGSRSDIADEVGSSSGPAPSRCPTCGAQVMETASNFCERCGTRLTPGSS